METQPSKHVSVARSFGFSRLLALGSLLLVAVRNAPLATTTAPGHGKAGFRRGSRLFGVVLLGLFLLCDGGAMLPSGSGSGGAEGGSLFDKGPGSPGGSPHSRSGGGRSRTESDWWLGSDGGDQRLVGGGPPGEFPPGVDVFRIDLDDGAHASQAEACSWMAP